MSKEEEITKSELILNILQQIEIGTSNGGNPCIKDIDDVVKSILRIEYAAPQHTVVTDKQIKEQSILYSDYTDDCTTDASFTEGAKWVRSLLSAQPAVDNEKMKALIKKLELNPFNESPDEGSKWFAWNTRFEIVLRELLSAQGEGKKAEHNLIVNVWDWVELKNGKKILITHDDMIGVSFEDIKRVLTEEEANDAFVNEYIERISAAHSAPSQKKPLEETGWISVDDRLPVLEGVVFSVPVLCLSIHGQEVMCYDYEFKRWNTKPYHTITHWMPLPPDPTATGKEGKDE